MGCGGSKSTKIKDSTSRANPGTVTQRQIELTKESWELVKPDMKEHGITFYTRLFSENPEMQQLFPFKDVEGIDKLKEDQRFCDQAERVMGMVGKAVEGLDNIPDLADLLKELGSRHVKWNVKEEHYGPVGEALIFALETGLGDKFTPEVKEAWLAVYGIVSDSMKAGAREAPSA